MKLTKKFLTYTKKIVINASLISLFSCNVTSCLGGNFDAKKASELLEQNKYKDLQKMFCEDFPPSKKQYKNIEDYNNALDWLKTTVDKTQDIYLSFELMRRMIKNEGTNKDAISEETGRIIFNLIHIIGTYKVIQGLNNKFLTTFNGMPEDPVDIWMRNYIHRLSKRQTNFIGLLSSPLCIEKKVTFEDAKKSYNIYYEKAIAEKKKNKNDIFQFIQKFGKASIMALFVTESSTKMWPQLYNIDEICTEKSQKNSNFLSIFEDSNIKGFYNKVMFATFKTCNEYLEKANDWPDLWDMPKNIKVKIIQKESNDKENILEL